MLNTVTFLSISIQITAEHQFELDAVNVHVSYVCSIIVVYIHTTDMMIIVLVL